MLRKIYFRLLIFHHYYYHYEMGAIWLLACVLGVMPITYPVGLWFLVAVTAHLLLHALEIRLASAKNSSSRKFLNLIARLSVHSLADGVKYIGFGIFVVLILQVLLALLISLDDVNRVREFLSWTYESLYRASDARFMVPMLAGLVVLSVAAPQFNFVDGILRLRTFVSKTLMILLSVTSFTFSGARDLGRWDEEWRSAERETARAHLGRMDTAAREMVAAEWVGAEALQLEQVAKEEFSQLFAEVLKTRSETEAKRIISIIASELAAKAPQQDPSIVKQTLPNRPVIPERINSYIQSDRTTVTSFPDKAPSLAELKAVNRQLDAQELRMRNLRDGVIKVTAQMFKEFISDIEFKSIKLMVEEVANKLANTVLSEIKASQIGDAAQVKSLIGKFLAGEAAIIRKAISRLWSLDPSSIRTKLAAENALRSAVASQIGNRIEESPLRGQKSTASIAGPDDSEDVAKQRFWERLRGPVANQSVQGPPKGPVANPSAQGPPSIIRLGK